MAISFADLEENALKLDVKKRAELVEKLILSLDLLSEAENEGLCADEAERRYHIYKSGKMSSRSADEVFSEIKKKISS
jgi:hypothetical protein